jgi:hypothetical protein
MYRREIKWVAKPCMIELSNLGPKQVNELAFIEILDPEASHDIPRTQGPDRGMLRNHGATTEVVG